MILFLLKFWIVCAAVNFIIFLFIKKDLHEELLKYTNIFNINFLYNTYFIGTILLSPFILIENIFNIIRIIIHKLKKDDEDTTE